MSESAKTFSVLGVAVLLAVAAFASRPHITTDETEGQVGQSLFPEWTDPSAAKSLAITSVDETTNSLSDFKVADVNGRWVVPSHEDYPANAEDHVFKAASSIIGLRVLAVVSDAPGDQETYGVVEPNEKTLSSSSFSDFGRLVVVRDAASKELAGLIVGKEDKSTAEGGSSNLRFVRRAGQDRIYKVSLDTDVLTTKFQDWVDTDILAMKQPWDVNSLLIRDYTLDRSVVRKDDIDLSFEENKAAWSLKKLTEYKDNEPKQISLPVNEELDSGKINELKTNISGLKLVNVARKPADFSKQLKTGKEWLGDPDAQDSLADGGFAVFPRQKPTEVLSAGGDMTIGMKDGVEYKLRFGGAAMTFKSDSGEKKNTAKKKGNKETNVERLVFVTAQFNPDLIPKPVLEPLPEAKTPAKETTPPKATQPNKTEPSKTEPKKAEPKVTEPPKTGSEKPEEKTPAANKPADKAPADKTPAAPKPAAGSSDNKPAEKSDAKPPEAPKGSQTNSRISGELLALADPTDDVKKTDGAKKPASDAKAPDAPKSNDKKPAETKTADKPAETTPAAKKPADKSADKKPEKKTTDDEHKTPEPAKPAAEKPKSDIQRAEEEQAREAERKRIETENRRKQDEYDDTVKKGKAHAKELNSRFADWYYMISEDEYKKVHIGLSDITKQKAGSDSLPPAPTNPFDAHGLKLPHP
ncbi:MAG TPA: hypothetical protein VHX65_06580 [Pirellulales bacterium]|nr:hypothetical protein [Pirellulales bacterium]